MQDRRFSPFADKRLTIISADGPATESRHTGVRYGSTHPGPRTPNLPQANPLTFSGEESA